MNISTCVDISRERERQDQQWGGPAHDDTHDAPEWLGLIYNQIVSANHAGAEVYDPSQVRARLVKIAALAVAGIQSIDRLHPAPEATEGGDAQ